MNTRIARSLDYWLGLLLCFLLTCINCILKIKSSTIKTKNYPQKIVFIKLSELGAIILGYPLFMRVRKEYPLAELFFVTFKKNKDIFRLLNEIIPDKNVFAIREDNVWLFIFDSFRVIRKLRQERVDIIFDLEFFSRSSTIVAYLIGANKRIGFYHYTFEGLYRGDLLTHKIQYNPLNHISTTYLSLSQVIRKKSKDTPELQENIDRNEIQFPKYISKSETKGKIICKLQSLRIKSTDRLLLLSPGEGVLPLREWPLDNFIILSRMLLEDKSNYIILIGSQGASKKGDDFLKSIHNLRCVSLIGQTSLAELLELFCCASALISNDCGLAHLAMLTPVKKFIIFGAESPQVFGSLDENSRIIYSHWPCSPCLSILNNRHSLCKDNWCLKTIKPEDVYKLVAESLKIAAEQSL